MGSASLQSGSIIDRSQVNDIAADGTGHHASAEGGVVDSVDVQLGKHNGLLILLCLRQCLVALNRLGVVDELQSDLAVLSLLYFDLGISLADNDGLLGDCCAAVQGFLHSGGQLFVGVLRCHPADQAAQAVLANILALGSDGADIIKGEEVTVVVAGAGAIEVRSLSHIVPVFLQVVTGNDLASVAVAPGTAGGLVRGRNGVGGRGCEQAGVLGGVGCEALCMDAAPAAGVSTDTHNDLGHIQLVVVSVLQVLDAGVNGDACVGIQVVQVLSCGIGVKRRLVSGEGSPCTVQVVGHHVQEVGVLQDLVVLDVVHVVRSCGHCCRQLVVLAVLLAQLVQACTQVPHQQGEVVAVGRTAGAALIDGNAGAFGIGLTVGAGILPVDIDEVEADIVDKLAEVVNQVCSLGRGSTDTGEVTAAGPAADGNAQLQVGVLVAKCQHTAENAGVGAAVRHAALVLQTLLEVCELIAEDQLAVGVEVHECEVQVGDQVALHVAGIEVVLAAINGPVAVIHYITVGVVGFCRLSGSRSCHGAERYTGEYQYQSQESC